MRQKLTIVLVLLAALSIGIAYTYSTTKGYTEPFSYGAPQVHVSPSILLLETDTREDIANKVALAFPLTQEMRNQFHDTYRVMQWDAFKEEVFVYMNQKYALLPREDEVLHTHSTLFLDTRDDILETFFVPGTYTFTGKESLAEIAEKLITPARERDTALFTVRINEFVHSALYTFLTRADELLPDLVPLPPQDVGLRFEGGKTLLVFTTIYYNKGLGNLELRGDAETFAALGDFERKVFQRISRPDGTFREREAGTFAWHNEHAHYHFADFVEYVLDEVKEDASIGEQKKAQKSTFCIRDVSRVDVDGIPHDESSVYRICGRERQGITVGWGDAYFQTYADQSIDISDLDTGIYLLTFNVNPSNRFDEMTKENNSASARIEYDKEEERVTVLEVVPNEIPTFEHIYVEKTYSYSNGI